MGIILFIENISKMFFVFYFCLVLLTSKSFVVIDGNPTSPPSRCQKDGPNGIGHCLDEFICCEYTGNNSWKETQCRCLNDFVFLEDFGICSWEEMCGYKKWQDLVKDQKLGIEYECDGEVTCPGI